MRFDADYRMEFSQMDFYEKMILSVKERFKDEVEVLLAYEVDFLNGIDNSEVLKRDADFFIGSVHFLNHWGFDNPEFIGLWKNRNIDDTYSEYFDSIEALAKSGQFDILGHIDLIKIFKFLPTKDIRILAKNALNTIKKSNLVVEINSAGLRKPIKELYPSDALFEELACKNIPITIGSDAHEVSQVGQNYDKALTKAKEFGYSKVAIFRKRDREFVEI